jgi:hypothetical protein
LVIWRFAIGIWGFRDLGIGDLELGVKRLGILENARIESGCASSPQIQITKSENPNFPPTQILQSPNHKITKSIIIDVIPISASAP